ncbi:MAG TPA: flagellin [Candidatus Sulfopaludibacter sp.]|jgi:flagellar hook-associated protein 3 FlgL|nr:flagellin [Candidatus Sulfopaludibacter sp.]
MNTNLSPSGTLYLANLNRIEQRISDASSQITSGKKLNVASDAPDEIGPLLQLRADRQRNQQIQSNLVLAQTDAQAADNALSSATALMDRATTLAAEGANATQTADTRASIAPEVQSLLEQMVSYSQTQVQGRYIFSGDQAGSPSYQLNLSNTDGSGVDRLAATGSTRLIEDPAGGTFASSKGAQEIFGPVQQGTDSDGNPLVDDSGNPVYVPTPDNAFAALNSLRVALLNNDTAGINTALNSIKQASTHLNSALTFYGTVETRIQDATNFATTYDTQLQTEISSKEDTDIPSAALELTAANTQLQAAMTMQGKLPTSTLFNYLG